MIDSSRGPGPDHDLFGFSPLPGRPGLNWPSGARVLGWLTLYLEYWTPDLPEGQRRATPREPWGTQTPDTRTYSHREFGNRVGIFRVLDVLDASGLPVTVAADGAACRRYPNLVAALRERGYEFVGHGEQAPHILASHLSETAERASIERSLDAVRLASGQPVRGWLGQDYSESPRTASLLAELGVRYVADWANDEQPYLMSSGLVSLPRQPDIEDLDFLWYRNQPTWELPVVTGRAARRLVADGERGGRVLGLGLHPWLSGQAHRKRYLAEMLDDLSHLDGLQFRTAAEIVDEFLVATAATTNSAKGDGHA